MLDKPYFQQGNNKLYNYGFQTIEEWNSNIKQNYTGELNKMAENKNDWKKVSSKIMKFEKIGDEIVGTLMNVETGHTYQNKVYKILDSDQELYAVFGTSVLDTQMSGIAIGSLIKIVYTGTTENKKKGLNAIKNFEVFVK